jgi:hypothetical protein
MMPPRDHPARQALSSSDQQLPDAPLPAAYPPLAVPRRRFARWNLAAIAMTAVVVALIAALLARAGVLTSKGPASNPVGPANWQTFRDGLGLYTLRMPSSWRPTESSKTTEHVGSRYGEFSDPLEFVTVSDPAQGGASASVSIVAGPIEKTAFEHGYYCGQEQSYATHYPHLPNVPKTFHGYAVAYLGPATLLFDSAGAHFQVDTEIPGVLEPMHSSPLESTPVPTATPLPATLVATDQTIVNEILASFQPTDPKPMAC